MQKKFKTSVLQAYLSLLCFAALCSCVHAACPIPSTNANIPFDGEFGLTQIFENGPAYNDIHFCQQNFSDADRTFAIKAKQINNQFDEDANGDGTLVVPLGAATRNDGIGISSVDISKVNNFSNINFNDVTGDIPIVAGAEDGTKGLFNFYSDTRRRRNSTCRRSSVSDNEFRYITSVLRGNAGTFFRARTGSTTRQAVSVNTGNTVARINNMPLENASGQQILADIRFVTVSTAEYRRTGFSSTNTWRQHLICQVGVKAIITVKANQPDGSVNALNHAGEYSTNVFINSQY